jgi:hypothetical protein
LTEKGIVPFIKLGLVLLAKLFKNEVDFAHNHSPMPPFGGGDFEFDVSYDQLLNDDLEIN